MCNLYAQRLSCINPICSVHYFRYYVILYAIDASECLWVDISCFSRPHSILVKYTLYHMHMDIYTQTLTFEEEDENGGTLWILFRIDDKIKYNPIIDYSYITCHIHIQWAFEIIALSVNYSLFTHIQKNNSFAHSETLNVVKLTHKAQLNIWIKPVNFFF